MTGDGKPRYVGFFNVNGTLSGSYGYKERLLSAIRNLAEDCSMKISLLTGDSAEKHVNLRKYLGTALTFSGFEMGSVIASPYSEKTSLLVDMDGYGSLKNAQLEIENFRVYFERELLKDFHAAFDQSGAWLSDRRHMLTLQGTNRVKGSDLKEYLRHKLPVEMEALLSKGLVKMVVSPVAVDLQPAIDKNVACRFVMKKLGLGPDDTLTVGHSPHSDLAYMKFGYPACPANADPEVKDFVATNNGYISSRSNELGVVDIIGHWAERHS